MISLTVAADNRIKKGKKAGSRVLYRTQPTIAAGAIEKLRIMETV
jgi:hypothetical protein